MIIVKLMDGLGNQMFQYAFARYLQVFYQEPIIFETVRFERGAVRQLGLQRLNIPLVNHGAGTNTCRMAYKVENRVLFITSKVIREFCEKIMKIPMTGEEAYCRMIRYGFYTTKDPLTFYRFQKTNAPFKFVRGYFQSEMYFKDIKNIIKKELRVRESEVVHLKSFAEQLRNQESVCVHIRRGDYVGNARFDICTKDYFSKAVEYMTKKIINPRFYVFSNSVQDLQWIKGNYDFLKDAHYIIEGENEYCDLYLMYHCKHHIISNSTFSWWGSYLNEREEGITIAPKKWLNIDGRQDIVLEEWVTL